MSKSKTFLSLAMQPGFGFREFPIEISREYLAKTYLQTPLKVTAINEKIKSEGPREHSYSGNYIIYNLTCLTYICRLVRYNLYYVIYL